MSVLAVDIFPGSARVSKELCPIPFSFEAAPLLSHIGDFFFNYEYSQYSFRISRYIRIIKSIAYRHLQYISLFHHRNGQEVKTPTVIQTSLYDLVVPLNLDIGISSQLGRVSIVLTLHFYGL